MADKNTNELRWSRDGLYRFIRPNFFVFTSLLLLLGVAAVDTNPDARTLLIAVAIAVTFHIFAYVQNDVLDLPVDRTQPLRAQDPLVTGLVSPGGAMTLAVSQVPISMLITWYAGGGVWAYITLLVAFALMTVYNMYGKRSPLPMLTDAVQGISWGSLAIYGSLITSGQVTVLSWLAFSFGFGFIFLINGVHGGLRDLSNDNAVGCNTTAIFFGAKTVDGKVVSTTSLRVFALIALATHTLPTTIALFYDAFGYESMTKTIVWAFWIVNAIVSVYVLFMVTAPIQPNRNEILRNHGIPLLLAPAIVFLPRSSVPLMVTALVCYYLPILLLDPPRMLVRRTEEGRN